MGGGAKLKAMGAIVIFGDMLHRRQQHIQVEAVKRAVSRDLSGRQSSRAITVADSCPRYVK